MLVHSLASKYARFVVLMRLMYWNPPPDQTIGPPPFKNPGHAPAPHVSIYPSS